MDGDITYEKELAFAKITVRITKIGEDYSVLLAGGTKPHIGCTVLTVPRPSLTGDGSISVTSSVLNLTGHKDEKICRYLAEQTAKLKNAAVVCTGGFHMDDITEVQIKEVIKAVEEIMSQSKETGRRG